MNRKSNRFLFEDDYDDDYDSDSQDYTASSQKKLNVKSKVLPTKVVNVSSATKQCSTIKQISKKPSDQKEKKITLDCKKTALTVSNDFIESFQKINLSSNIHAISSHPNSLCEHNEKPKNSLEPLGLVVIGEVDSGKSTLIGQFLCQMGVVQLKQVERLRQLAPKGVKPSDVYSWICDELEEERERGMTLYVTTKTFETETRHITILDTPGHQELKQRMLKAAIIADVAVIVFPLKNNDCQLVVQPELEQQIQLIHFLGLESFIVVINKFDKVDWNEALYNAAVTAFQTLFNKLNIHLSDSQLIFVPVSALHCVNLVNVSNNDDTLNKKTHWLQERKLLTLLQAINCISIVTSKETQLQCENALIVSVMDAYQVNRNAHVSGRILQGTLKPKNCATIFPLHVQTTVLDVKNNERVMTEVPSGYFVNNVALDTLNVFPGCLLCHGNHNVLVADTFLVYLCVLNTDIAILPGLTCTVNIHLAEHVVTILSLNVLLLRGNKHQNIANPRYLSTKDQAIVCIKSDDKIAFQENPSFQKKSFGSILSRVLLWHEGSPVAFGCIILSAK